MPAHACLKYAVHVSSIDVHADSTDIWEQLKAAKVVLLPGRAMHCRCGP